MIYGVPTAPALHCTGSICMKRTLTTLRWPESGWSTAPNTSKVVANGRPINHYKNVFGEDGSKEFIVGGFDELQLGAFNR